MTAKAKWTFMVYLAGDNNLSDAGDTDLAEMRQVGSTPEINVVVEFDNAGSRGTQRFRVERAGASEHLDDLGETDSGSPDVLYGFVDWAVDAFPAERYALILWNHGGGWEPTEMDRIARSVGSRSYNAREATERAATPLKRAFFRSTLQTVFGLPSPSERAICSDDGTGHSLDTIELGRVLARVAQKLGQPLDLLGMDACLMSNLEVAYEAKPYVRYIVGSEETEPNEGWPYGAVLGKLTATPAISAPDLANSIVQAYVRSYVERGYTGAVTQSAFDLSKVDGVAVAVDTLANALVARMPGAAARIWGAQRRSARFFHNTLWDVAQFCEELPKGYRDATVRKAADGVRAVLKPGTGRFVLSQAHSGDTVRRVGGLSVYLLPPLMDVSRYYADLDFAQQHRWAALLQAYHAA